MITFLFLPDGKPTGIIYCDLCSNRQTSKELSNFPYAYLGGTEIIKGWFAFEAPTNNPPCSNMTILHLCPECSKEFRKPEPKVVSNEIKKPYFLL
jgi:hypothetical protein